MRNKTLVIYFTENKKCRQVIKLNSDFEGSVKDLVHDISFGTYYRYEVF